jgi:hypothetical protein
LPASSTSRSTASSRDQFYETPFWSKSFLSNFCLGVTYLISSTTTHANICDGTRNLYIT